MLGEHPTHPTGKLLIELFQVFGKAGVQLFAAVFRYRGTAMPHDLAMHAVKEGHRSIRDDLDLDRLGPRHGVDYESPRSPLQGAADGDARRCTFARSTAREKRRRSAPVVRRRRAR